MFNIPLIAKVTAQQTIIMAREEQLTHVFHPPSPLAFHDVANWWKQPVRTV